MTDEKKARRVIDFIQCLRHTKGEFHGKPFKLLPWQEKIIRDVFGTVREDDPTIRQYTTAYIEIPKKQGKALAGSLSGMGVVLKPESGTCGASKSRTMASVKSCLLPARSTAGRQHIASAIRETPEGVR